MKRRGIVIAGIFAAVALAAAVLFPVGFAYGWFFGSDDTANPSESGNISVSVKVAFDGVAATVRDGLIEVNVTDSAAANRPERMKVTVSLNTKIDCVLRVRISNLWVNVTGEGAGAVTSYPRLDSVKFARGGDFVDNVAVDGCYYYYSGGAHVIGAGTAVDLTVLDGTTAAQNNVVYETGTTLYLDVRVQAVQANRWQEIWQLDSLPSA